MARFFRVKPEEDQTNVSGGIIVCIFAGELFTKEELIAYGVPLRCVDPIDVPEEDTYWSFGTRRLKGE